MLRVLLVAFALLLWEPPPTLTLFWYPDGLLVRWAGPYGCLRIEGPTPDTYEGLGCSIAGEVLIPRDKVTPGYVVRYYVGVDTVGAEKVILEPHDHYLPLVAAQ